MSAIAVFLRHMEAPGRDDQEEAAFLSNPVRRGNNGIRALLLTSLSPASHLLV
jgi:hypothetical protein